MEIYINKEKAVRRRRKKRLRCILNLFLTIALMSVFIALAIYIITLAWRCYKTNTQGLPLFSYNENEIADSAEGDWSLILVNRWNSIPPDYEVKLAELENGQKIDERIYKSLKKMFIAAEIDGVYLNVISGYRTAENQQQLLEDKLRDYKNEGFSEQEATSKAEAWVALPGTSEHQLGISVDINSDGINSTNSEVYDWLDENAYKFGFIYRFPPNKTEITGVINEPWHYRYVGKKAAKDIYNNGLCLEEYLAVSSGMQP